MLAGVCQGQGGEVALEAFVGKGSILRGVGVLAFQPGNRSPWRLGMATGGALEGLQRGDRVGQKRFFPIYGSPSLVSELLRMQVMTGRFLVHMKFTRPSNVNLLGRF